MRKGPFLCCANNVSKKLSVPSDLYHPQQIFMNNIHVIQDFLAIVLVDQSLVLGTHHVKKFFSSQKTSYVF